MAANQTRLHENENMKRAAKKYRLNAYRPGNYRLFE
jgi:hypothetical protein